MYLSAMFRSTTVRSAVLVHAALAIAAAVGLAAPAGLAAGGDEIAWSPAEKPLADEISGLRKVPDDERGAAMTRLAQQIRHLPAAPNKLRLAIYLASLSTEGDFGLPTLKEVARTLQAALREKTIPWRDPKDAHGEPSSDERLPAYGYRELASLAHFEHVPISLNEDVHYRDAVAALIAADAKRARADFTLTDLSGKPWTLSALRGKVVLVNFWATWCPPCRKELPDLETLYSRFSPQGLVILGISDEDVAKVEPFVRQHAISYPILLDSQKIANEAFEFQGIPKSFVFDRSGKLVAEAMDMRTQAQFLAMLRSAGLQEPRPFAP